MERFYAVEAAMALRVFAYNLFLLFKQTILGQKEKRQQIKTLRYKYFVLPAQMGKTGRDAVSRISVMNRKIRAKLVYLFPRISQYIIALQCLPPYHDITREDQSSFTILSISFAYSLYS